MFDGAIAHLLTSPAPLVRWRTAHYTRHDVLQNNVLQNDVLQNDVTKYFFIILLHYDHPNQTITKTKTIMKIQNMIKM